MVEITLECPKTKTILDPSMEFAIPLSMIYIIECLNLMAYTMKEDKMRRVKFIDQPKHEIWINNFRWERTKQGLWIEGKFQNDHLVNSYLYIQE